MSTRKSFRAAGRKIERLSKEQGRRVPSGLRVIGEGLRMDMVATRPGRGVPRDEGILAASHRVDGPLANGEVHISAGGAAAPYALKQHEDLSLHHPRGGEARWMVRAIERWTPDGSAGMRALKANAEAGVRAAAKS